MNIANLEVFASLFVKQLTDFQFCKTRQFSLCHSVFFSHLFSNQSGFKGGLFLERGRVKKPSNDRFPVELSDYYKPSDAYVGAVLEFNHFKFELTDADEYTMKYMEDHSTEFPVSDINLILDKLKTFAKTRCDELQQYAINQDPEHTGTFGYRQLQCLIDQLTGPEHALRLHEMHTLGRHYAEK